MPVTARLSKKFYDTFGEELAQEMVDWFNQVDATYRADLRELNELNFARFDVKLEQRVTELDAKLERRIGQLDAKLERRLAELETRLDAKIERRTAELDARITALESKIEHQLVAFEARMDQTMRELRAELLTDLRTNIATAKADTIKWMFVFWLGTVGTFLAVARVLVA